MIQERSRKERRVKKKKKKNPRFAALPGEKSRAWLVLARLASSECWEGARGLPCCPGRPVMRAPRRGNVARDAVFSMQKSPCLVQEAV